MSVKVPKDVEERVLHLVESGRYRDSGAAMREAVNLLEERDRRLSWLQSAAADAVIEAKGLCILRSLSMSLKQNPKSDFFVGTSRDPISSR